MGKGDLRRGRGADGGADARHDFDCHARRKASFDFFAAAPENERIADGLAPDMPVAVIENASRAEMRVLRSPLAGLAALVERQRVKSPAVIIIGDVTDGNETQLRALALEAIA